MPWHVSNFHEVKFNQDDNGWLTVYGIHRGISERAESCGHSIAEDYEEEFGLALYLGDPDGDSERAYLKEVLEQFYADIQLLIDGDVAIRWTVASGRSDEWTIESLTDDIALGQFSDTLTRAANPLSFMWLQAALDRLIHVKKTANIRGEVGNVQSSKSGSSLVSAEAAWDVMAAASQVDATLSIGNIVALVGFQTIQAPFTGLHTALTTLAWDGATIKELAGFGDPVDVDYNYTPSDLNSDLHELDIEVGVVALTPVTIDLSAGPGVIQGEAAEIEIGSVNSDLSIVLITEIPSDSPITETNGNCWVRLDAATVYYDIAAYLADQ